MTIRKNRMQMIVWRPGVLPLCSLNRAARGPFRFPHDSNKSKFLHKKGAAPYPGAAPSIIGGCRAERAKPLRRGLLLGDAVDVAAAEDDLLGLHAHALVDALAPHLVVDLLQRVTASWSFSSPYWGTMTPPLVTR